MATAATGPPNPHDLRNSHVYVHDTTLLSSGIKWPQIFISDKLFCYNATLLHKWGRKTNSMPIYSSIRSHAGVPPAAHVAKLTYRIIQPIVIHIPVDCCAGGDAVAVFGAYASDLSITIKFIKIPPSKGAIHPNLRIYDFFRANSVRAHVK